jgi:hypothetical protein
MSTERLEQARRAYVEAVSDGDTSALVGWATEYGPDFFAPDGLVTKWQAVEPLVARLRGGGIWEHRCFDGGLGCTAISSSLLDDLLEKLGE